MALSPNEVTFDRAIPETSISRVVVRMPTDDDDLESIQWFDNTRMTAINTCPTWGMIRYMRAKTNAGAGRAMALEAGTVSHDVFCAARLYDCIRYFDEQYADHAWHHGARLLGEKRWKKMLSRLGADDRRTEMMQFCLEALYSSEYYDDPSDKQRTMANIEESCMAYLDSLPWGKHPPYVSDQQDPSGFLGVEIKSGFIIEFWSTNSMTPINKYYITGRVDGLHWHGDKLCIEENKTASRLDDAWLMSFEMAHQVTGYAIAMTLLTGVHVEHAYILGMKIPLPRTYDYGGIVRERVHRSMDRWWDWIQWCYHTTAIYEKYKDNYDAAPRYTHSCNRYFRSCSFIHYCAAKEDEREDIFNNFVDDEWNPHDD